jgi:glycine/D-amino acid oxidase-like deaminating enzyme
MRAVFAIAPRAATGQTTVELNTSLRNATVTRVCWGARPVTATGLPVFGKSRLPGLHVACGTHRQGINIAPVIGEAVAADVVQGAAQDHAFSPLQKHAVQVRLAALLHVCGMHACA